MSKMNSQDFFKELSEKYRAFLDVARNKKWPQIGGKNLKNFPNAIFNREHNIGNKKGQLYSSTDLKQLFAVLGIPVSEDQKPTK